MKPILKLLILITCIGVANCKKETLTKPSLDGNLVKPAEPQKPIKRIKVTDELKDWAYFKPGSYWIVRNYGSTTMTDSIFIHSIKTDSVIYHINDTVFVFEKINIQYGGQYAHPTMSLNSYKNSVIIIAPGINSHIYTELPIFSPDSSRISKPGLKENSHVAAFTIENQAYTDLRFVRYHYSFNNNDVGGEAYWKKHAGLLESTHFGHRFTVLRYHTIQ